MARYRGKHRKPSAAGRNMARVALTGAVAAVPFAGAIPANAASESTWDAVAQCESDGNWQISTGNGFSGGLQFTKSTWSSFGGDEYASNAKDATKEQQIAVAERILQEQGPKAWPNCSKKAGLSTGALENQDVSGGNGGSESSTKQTKSKPAPKQTKAPSTGEYTVESGDTLGKIGQKLGVHWGTLFEANKGTLHDPNMILPGQEIKVG